VTLVDFLLYFACEASVLRV